MKLLHSGYLGSGNVSPASHLLPPCASLICFEKKSHDNNIHNNNDDISGEKLKKWSEGSWSDWFFLSTGKMFKSLDLSLIVEFMLMFYKDKPIDWLLDHIMWVKVCNPEKDAVRKHMPTHTHSHAPSRHSEPERVCVSETLRPAEGQPEDPL